MERTRISLLALALLCAGIAVMAVSGAKETAGASPSPVVEEVRYEWLPDGRIKQTRALIDTRIADPEAVMAKLAPGAVPEPEVTAAFVTQDKWATGDIPVEVLYNAALEPGLIGGAAALQWAIDTWNAVPTQGFSFSFAGATQAEPPACDFNNGDGLNTVRFSGLLEEGVLGETCSFLFGSVGQFDRVVEFDMHLDAGTDWSRADPTPGWAYDLDSVVLHELGHALGLGHSSYGTVMQPFLDYGQQVRNLSGDDIAGVQAIYGVGASPTATPTKTPTQATPSATTPGNLTYRIFAAMLGRDEPAATPPPSTPTPTPTPTPTATATASPPAAVVGVRNGTWYTSLTGSIRVVGEAFNGLDHPVGFVEVTANFYSGNGTLLATDFGFADLYTIPPGGDSPFTVLLIDPPAGIESVQVQVTDYDPTPSHPVTTGLTVSVTNVYRSITGSVHVVGTVSNTSPYTYEFVEILIAFYSEGRVVRTDFTFSSPSTLAPGASGTFDLLVINAPEGLEDMPRRLWVDGNR